MYTHKMLVPRANARGGSFRLRHVVFIAGAVAVAACTVDREPTNPRASLAPGRDEGNASSGLVRPGEIVTEDELYARLADQVPGFAGVYPESGGRLVVSAVPEGRPVGAGRVAVGETAIRSALAAFLTAHGTATSPDAFAVRSARYDFRQLVGWHLSMASALTLPGAVLTDLDERNGVVSVGLTPAAIAAGVGEQVAAIGRRAGIPDDALEIHAEEPFRVTQTLRDQFRPTAGGIEIGPSSCTLSFNASWHNPQTGVVSPAFLTASHCTSVDGQNNGDHVSQPDTSLVTIGTEAYDPPYFRGSLGSSCPSGRRCRFSDAAVFTYAGGISSPFVIARTMFAGGSVGSLDVNPSSPTFAVLAKGVFNTTSLVPFSKVGRTTGWTQGSLTITCVTVNKFDANGNDTGLTMLCQDRVGAGQQGGDSGAPVFRQFSNDPNKVELFGIAWGSNGTSLVFSALHYIEQEVGTLDVF